jgi:serine/threonine protein kinase
MPNLIGQSLGRYHILEQLGEGGMAVVYKAFDTRLERKVAVKVILPSRQQNEKFLKRFEREARSLAQLTHPNIVGVMDYGDYEGLPYLVMEYLPGGTLKQKLTGKPVPWQEAALLLAPVARALEHAHKHGIIHRDVKPSNILITDSGQPMLADFGIAKILDAEETADLTGSSTGVGTPEYMAPEQGLGHAVDARTDVYALGIVFYEMVTGRKPYQADTPMAVVLKHVTEPLPRPGQFVHGLPDRVEETLLKALAKQPHERFADMGAFADRLEELARGEIPKGEKKKHEPSRPRWIWAVAAGLGLLVCLVAVTFAWRLWQASGLASQGMPTQSDVQFATALPSVIQGYSPSATSRPQSTFTTETPYCPGPLPSRLSVGMNAEVTTSGKAWQLRLRSDPSFSASTNHIIAAGRDMIILNGPTCAEGSFWWYVRSEQGYEGWAPEGDFEDYWIDPLP